MKDIIEIQEGVNALEKLTEDKLTLIITMLGVLDMKIKKFEKSLNEYANDSGIKPKYVTESVAMKMLNVKSKSQMWKYRVEGKLTYIQIGRKIIMYEVASIEAFLEANKHEAF